MQWPNFSVNLKQNIFDPICSYFSQFGCKKCCFKSVALSCATSHDPLTLYQSSEKTIKLTVWKCSDTWQQDGWTDHIL